MKNLKQQLYTLCNLFIEQRIANTKEAIQNASESANDETKSSAGDKHETGRAMAQLEQEKAVTQLNEALELQAFFKKINPEIESKTAQVGSVVLTDKGNFFLAIPAGKLTVNKQQYFAISAISPIGLKLRNLTKNQQFDFNNQVYRIIDVF
ncbi:hypothetical protein BH10BAC1_BH10BAC1_06840 [soil metagenome]